jgi:tetratricopeptide (TPR) repeat protein
MKQPTQALPFEQAFRAALAHANAGDLAAAAAACTLLRSERPHDPAVLQLAATIAYRLGRLPEARDTIRLSLARRPGHVPSLLLAARLAEPSDQAEPLLRQAIAASPELPEPAFLLCHTLLGLGDASIAGALAWAGQRHPGHAAEWQKLGIALQRARHPAAGLAFARAAAAEPASAEAQFGLGLSARDAGRMQEAATALYRAVALDPCNSAAWFALGLTCQDLNDEAGAAMAYRAALREKPDFAEAAVNLGIACQRLGNMPGAIAAYRSAIRIRPDSFGRIAQAVTSASTGMLCLDPAAFRRLLTA